MSERILKALMQLFALVADVDGVSNHSRKIVELFLKQQLNSDMVKEYLVLYDEFLETYHKISKKKEGKKKRTSLNSVKVLKICTQINTELAQKQKVIVLLRLVEYVNSDGSITEQEDECITTVAESFNISSDEFNLIREFTTYTKGNVPNNQQTLIINDKPNELSPQTENKCLTAENLDGDLVILRVESVGLFTLKYFGKTELILNGQAIGPKTCHVLTPGSSIRSSKVNPIYYSDILSKFMSDSSQQKIVFTADHIEYEFKGGKKGLHTLTFSEESGKLLGVMGGSGAGKSTLLNVLNGNNRPSAGRVLVNGLSIHDDKDKIEGVVGYVSQDDLLIEELTVFQNLFYNAKLCFDGFTDKEITKRVLDLLNSIGLYEAKDLKVGSPLEKTISGGQRKRLNIALELIREPSVLFVDEPTSGLSSRDSENIMDLLKELALKGKVIFVVIHQPSSDIFKMFDKLLILDLGGRPIYYGNPVDGVLYFKKLSNHVNSDESECIQCGNVNPEQIFNIIESKVLDEYGNLTDNRKFSPKEWNEHYHNEIDNKINIISAGTEVPKSTFNIPNKIKQFKVFITRDVLSKFTNSQYLMINLLEAPILAAILAFFVKFYHTDVTAGGYIFRENENLIAYIFMAVVIALFIGLTVSAEEIIKDQKIRKRESFLNLSSGSYLVSKISIMFALSAFQTLTFVLVGNTILGIQGMYFDYWLVLFSTACFANMLGLNISASFNSAVTIYISIPFLLIPQLLFSGLIIKFEKLNPVITSQTHVPFIGDSMASRWAFEALVVNQFKNNEFEKYFYEYDKG
ncbi:MAG: ATP-binding cassette domain-containing protein, partial [Flavobacteriales bacterium]|nr:ATP-binding cassette domain-containing protein [Flavobacteriales bacterium]